MNSCEVIYSCGMMIKHFVAKETNVKVPLGKGLFLNYVSILRYLVGQKRAILTKASLL